MAGVPIMISCAATRPVAILGLEQRLRDHRAQRFRQHRAHHFLFGRREHVDDAVDGLGRDEVCSVPNTRWPVSAAGQRQTDGFQVAHFAHQDDVGVLAQRRAQRVG
jgi:hypothetical protein